MFIYLFSTRQLLWVKVSCNSSLKNAGLWVGPLLHSPLQKRVNVEWTDLFVGGFSSGGLNTPVTNSLFHTLSSSCRTGHLRWRKGTIKIWKGVLEGTRSIVMLTIQTTRAFIFAIYICIASAERWVRHLSQPRLTSPLCLSPVVLLKVLYHAFFLG
jgi:hypothetical protein